MRRGRTWRMRRRKRKNNPRYVALETTIYNSSIFPTEITVKIVDPVTSFLQSRPIISDEIVYLLHCSSPTDSDRLEQFELVIIAIQHGHIKKPQLSDALTEGRNFSEFHILEVSNKQLLSGPVVFTAFI